jgi:DNA primase
VTSTHADRDAVKARAETDFPNLYQEHGGRSRGKALHCIFHQDRNPSARIQKGRFQCFTCNVSLDVFAFIEKAHGADFQGALSYLADRYGVPLKTRALTGVEKREYAEAQRIRAEAPYFADAAALMAEWALEELSPTDPERAEHTALLAGVRISPEAEYRWWLQHRPTWAAALVQAGRERTKRLQVALARWIAAGMPDRAGTDTANVLAKVGAVDGPEALHAA